MGRIVISENGSLDGVVEDPAGDEGFERGGWVGLIKDRPQLNQLNFGYRRVEGWLFQFGKFLVPFGRYNELYRPDQFLTVTRPLLYASPDSLDLVVRLNSPRPPVSSGYTDIGARISYYPRNELALVPDELTFFVVNGFGETNNRQRTFPDTDNLGIPDGHERVPEVVTKTVHRQARLAEKALDLRQVAPPGIPDLRFAGRQTSIFIDL